MKKFRIIISLVFVMMLAASCGGGSSSEGQAPEIEGLTYESRMELDYAKCFDVYYYKDGYRVIDIHDDSMYLAVPKGMSAPDSLPDGMVVIPYKPEKTYLAATSAMALVDRIDALDSIRMTEMKADGWEIENARKAMQEGRIEYAGKYNQPDYELLLEKQCDLAIESTMIYHCPEVKEMLEELGIPVLVDRSSYEEEPLGRTEWIKLYGAIFGKEDAAEKFFNSQKDRLSELDDCSDTGKTVTFFYVTSSGKVVVRSSSDYIPRMIELAGGEYIFKNLNADSDKVTASMTLEAFYEAAVDADYIVYNETIDNSVKKVSDLVAKNEVFAKFKAVKEGNCYLSGDSLYQRSDSISEMIVDFNSILNGKDDKLVFMKKME